MYTLRMSPASPYARKVRMAITAFGLQDQITMQTTDTNDLGDSLQSKPAGAHPGFGHTPRPVRVRQPRHP